MKKEEQYFAIRCSDDGVYVTKIKDIQKFLDELYPEENDEFLDDFPADRWNKKRDEINNGNYPEHNEIILIKGKIVVPNPKKTVTKYEVED